MLSTKKVEVEVLTCDGCGTRFVHENYDETWRKESDGQGHAATCTKCGRHFCSECQGANDTEGCEDGELCPECSKEWEFEYRG